MDNQEQNPSGTELEAKLEQLNRFTRRTLTQEEVFLFDVRLCDNEIDRDGERFSLEAPWLMRSPIVRNGNKVTVGYCPQVWEQWIAAEK